MKQTLLMLALLLVGTVGSFVKGPFYGVAVYYLFAILRPQYLWQWASLPGIQWSFFVAIATIAASIFWHKTGSGKGWLKPGSAAMLLFGIWVTLSYFFAIDSTVSYPPYIEYLKIFIMFFCSMRVISEFSQVRVLYLVGVISLGYIAYEVNFLYLVNGRLDIFHNGYGGLDNNGAGLMIAMGVPMAFFLWQGLTRWWRWFFLAMIPVMLHAVLMTYSRGAMVSLLAASPLYVMRSTKENRKLMIAGLACLVMLLPFLAGKEIRARFFTVNEYKQDESAQSRFGSWEAAFKIAMDYPVFGVGVRNANLLSHQYGADMQGRTIHSVYLQIAADCGFPAMGFYVAIFFIAWRNLRRLQMRYRSSTSGDYKLAYNLACGIEASMAVFCVGAAFLSLETFELPYFLILLALQLPASFQVLTEQEEKLNQSRGRSTQIYEGSVYSS
ncbi:MAG: putative O-glycosylation ligase, exosortase A system-associated [Syntrophobacteraceae bacterium]